MKLAITIGFLFIILTAYGQDKEKIETISVSVNSATQEVTIKWKPFSDTSKIKWYVIYEYDNSPGKVGVIPASAIFVDDNLTQHTFSYPKVNDTSVFFAVYAQDGPKIVPTTFEEYKNKNISGTIFINKRLEYDSCFSIINIKWNRYIGWGPTIPFYGNVKEYQVINLLTNETVGVTSDTTFILNNVNPNTTYQFKVVAVQEADPTITSHSNSALIYTKTTQPPAFIHANSASYVNSEVELHFELDGSSSLKNYWLTRSSSPTGVFTKIADYPNIITPTYSAIDNNPLPITSYYRLEALNLCNLPAMPSNVATALVPRAVLNGQTINVSWDAYENWSSGVHEYRVYRKLGTSEPQLFQTISPGPSLFILDDISNLTGQNMEGRICYHVVAVSNGTPQYESVSRDTCINLTSDIVLPNAFTPDGNGKNDEFKPSFTFLPTNFKMVIFDRYGYKIFETSEITGWNGLLNNGKKAPEGTYIYFVTYTSNVGMTIEKKGSVTLIYP